MQSHSPSTCVEAILPLYGEDTARGEILGPEMLATGGTSFGATGSGFARINIGTTRARVAEAAERIARTLGN